MFTPIMHSTNSTGETFLQQCKSKRAELGPKKCQVPLPRYDFTLPDLPTEWCWASLSEICARVSVGHVGPTSQYFTDDADGIPLVRSQDVRPGLLRLDNTLRITLEFHRKLKKSTLKSGDILFVRVGANRGDCCVVPQGTVEINCANIVFARPLFPNGFFGFYFRSDLAQKFLLSATTGAAQGVINTESVARMPVPIPPLPTQEEIASILSAYDDLIENNTRRIKILEEMAQMIYREWFVDFRFPGHKEVAVVTSGGLVGPAGWERTVVERTCVSVEDGDWIETKDQGGDSYRLLQVSNIGLNAFIETDNYRFVSKETFQRLRCREVLPGDILVARMPSPIGRAWLVTPQPWRMITAVDVAILTPKEATSLFLLHFLNSAETLAACSAQASGTTRARITRRQIASVPVLLPPEEVRVRFAGIVQPVNELMDNLRNLNRTLSRTRNLLLPKLISGEINVEQCEAVALAQGV